MDVRALRRSTSVVLIACVLFGGCTRSTLDDQVGRPSGADTATSQSVPAGGPDTTSSTKLPPGVPTTAPTSPTSAAPGNVVGLNQGQPGVAQLPDGARLTVPAGAVTSPKAQVRLDTNGAGQYSAALDGQVQGTVEMRIPAGTTDPNRQSFLLASTPGGWTALSTDRRPDGFLYGQVALPVTVRALNCDATLQAQAAAVLGCLAAGGVTQLAPPVAAQVAQGLGCGSPWPATSLLRREDYCLSTPSEPTRTTQAPAPAAPTPTTAPAPAPNPPPNTGAAPAPPTAAPQPERLQVVLTEDPVVCNGDRRAFGYVANAVPGEQVTFSFAGDGALSLLPGTADGSGQVTIHWKCNPGDAPNSWRLTATGASSGRTVTFSFSGSPG